MLTWCRAPPEYDWDARTEEVKSEYRLRAEAELTEWEERVEVKITVEVGKNSLLVVWPDKVHQIPFPVKAFLSFTGGKDAFIDYSGRHVSFDKVRSSQWEPWCSSFGKTEHHTIAAKFVPARSDVVHSNGVDYHLPYRQGRQVYDLLFQNMRDNA